MSDIYELGWDDFPEAKEEDEVRDSKSGASLIAEERRRQVSAEGWSAAHDDEHGDHEIIDAAICYAHEAGRIGLGACIKLSDRSNHFPRWPWEPEWWKSKGSDNGTITIPDSIHMLAKAGALIAAEIDRLQRLARKEPTPRKPSEIVESCDGPGKVGEMLMCHELEHGQTVVIFAASALAARESTTTRKANQ